MRVSSVIFAYFVLIGTTLRFARGCNNKAIIALSLRNWQLRLRGRGALTTHQAPSGAPKSKGHLTSPHLLKVRTQRAMENALIGVP